MNMPNWIRRKGSESRPAAIQLATETVSVMTDIVFQTTEIVRLLAPVFAPNDASKKVLEKCGYHLEGI